MTFASNINNILKGKKEVNKMVEFDAIKQSLANYAQPLLEMGIHFDLANKKTGLKSWIRQWKNRDFGIIPRSLQR